MIADCSSFIESANSIQERWQRIVNCLYAGYITLDVSFDFYEKYSSDPDFKNYSFENLEYFHELYQESSNQPTIPFMRPRKIALDYEAALKFKPEGVDSVWQTKDALDNCHAKSTPNDSKLVALTMLEEYGFIRIGNRLISRTIQPVYMDGFSKGVAYGVATCFPAYFQEGDTNLFKTLPTRQSIGGGFSYYGIFEVKKPCLDSSYGLGANVIFKCVGIPESFDKPYPFTRLQYPPQEIPVYEGVH